MPHSIAFTPSRRMRCGALLLASLATPSLSAQTLDWASSSNFKFNILGVSYTPANRTVTVVFNLTNPLAANAPYNLQDKTRPPFISPARLAVDVAWNTAGWKTTELVNTNSAIPLIPRTWIPLDPLVQPAAGGAGPATPISVNLLSAAAKACNSAGSPCPAVPNAGLAYYATALLPLDAVGGGRVGLEGHAVRQTGVDATGAPVYINIPIKGVVADYAVDGTFQTRRRIVDFAKCQRCHDDRQHGNTIVPRLSLHGANRNEEPELCVTCHNPNQTDAGYRTSGVEESIDFKRLIHGIHAGGMRKNKLIVIGFRGAVNDFSGVRFPAELRNCTLCHIDSNGKGTFELPVASVLGSTIRSGSDLSRPGTVDAAPAGDLRISPIAAACSACHDSPEVQRHMIQRGASFGATQAALAGKEQCANCHGAGREESVRSAHEIRSSTRSSESGERH